MGAKNLNEPRMYKGNKIVSLQSEICQKKVKCPVCGVDFRCLQEGDYRCSSCGTAFLPFLVKNKLLPPCFIWYGGRNIFFDMKYELS